MAGGDEAGWPGLLIDEEHGGAGLDAFDAMLVLGECGRVCRVKLSATCPPPRSSATRRPRADVLAELASGERRAAYLPARPPSDLDPQLERRPGPRSRRSALPSAGRAARMGALP